MRTAARRQPTDMTPLGWLLMAPLIVGIAVWVLTVVLWLTSRRDCGDAG